jgi:hypothetical protein
MKTKPKSFHWQNNIFITIFKFYWLPAGAAESSRKCRGKQQKSGKVMMSHILFGLVCNSKYQAYMLLFIVVSF